MERQFRYPGPDRSASREGRALSLRLGGAIAHQLEVPDRPGSPGVWDVLQRDAAPGHPRHHPGIPPGRHHRSLPSGPPPSWILITRRWSTWKSFWCFPLVMVIFWFWFLIPQITGTNTRVQSTLWPSPPSLSSRRRTSARSSAPGIQSVPRGQVEAATAGGPVYGLKRRYVLRHPPPGNPDNAPLTGHAVHRPLQGHLASLHHRL